MPEGVFLAKVAVQVRALSRAYARALYMTARKIGNAIRGVILRALRVISWLLEYYRRTERKLLEILTEIALLLWVFRLFVALLAVAAALTLLHWAVATVYLAILFLAALSTRTDEGDGWEQRIASHVEQRNSFARFMIWPFRLALLVITTAVGVLVKSGHIALPNVDRDMFVTTKSSHAQRARSEAADTQARDIHFAAKRGDLQAVSNALARGADVNEMWSDGTTALMLAAEHGQVAVVRLLLSAGADPKIRDRYGRSALSIAQTKGHDLTVDVLRKANDLNAGS